MPAELRRGKTRGRTRRRSAVTSQSGKHRDVHFRWACNKRFSAAVATFADNGRQVSLWAAKVYRDARARGKDYAHAMSILGRAWISVIWPCWLDDNPYDSASTEPTPHSPNISVKQIAA